MSIVYYENEKIFHLQGKDVSYICKVDQYDHLIHVYYGKKIRHINTKGMETTKPITWSLMPVEEDENYALDTALLEYATYGHVDHRTPALHIEQANGSTIMDLTYESHHQYKGKKELEGLPATYANEEEAETLDIILSDTVSGVQVVLSYTVFNKLNVITRSVQIINKGEAAVKILSAQSCCVDFEHANYDMMHLSGAWARERHVVRRKVVPGVQSIGSTRGASSHVHNPFLALLTPDATEETGQVYGFNFVYSGNFCGHVSVQEHDRTRVLMGIHPFNFSWQLEVKETFQTPEVVMVYSGEGLGGMSREYHRLYRKNLMRGVWKEKERPVLINSWEAAYFDFTRKSIEALAEKASEIGVELCVLDDGWFSKRDDDRSSLGDWIANNDKLEGGLDILAKNINKMDMAFGLWFEPEMVSPDSELYRKHPDWCLYVEGREHVLTRHQLTLDFSRKEVCDYIRESVSSILSSAPITYVKWDMNRYMSNVSSKGRSPKQQMETPHRYMLGLYYVLEELVKRHPEVLFEGCAGGGGRFDPGMLYYMPQIWTSDDTDAIERLKIQYGTSMVYPIMAMGSHVSSVPNHQLERVTPLETRAHVAMSGNLGYELDITQYSEDEMDTLRQQIAFYKANRQLIQFGDFYRLKSPFEDNSAAWMFVSTDQTEAIVFYMNILGIPNPMDQHVKLSGLHEAYDYAIEGMEGIFGGDQLMYGGLTLPVLKDFESVCYTLNRVKPLS